MCARISQVDVRPGSRAIIIYDPGSSRPIQGGPEERNSRYSRFSGLCSDQQLLSSIEHLFPIIITSRSSNLVENFLFYETFLMDCHFGDLPDFQSFEAR